MAVQDDLTVVYGERTSKEAIMGFWAAAEYMARVAQEQLEVMKAARDKVDLPACPDSIKQNGQGVLTKLQGFVDALTAEHAAFLTWTPPE